MFLFLKNNIHLTNTLLNLFTFYFIKPINFDTEIRPFCWISYPFKGAFPYDVKYFGIFLTYLNQILYSWTIFILDSYITILKINFKSDHLDVIIMSQDKDKLPVAYP